MEHFKLMRPLVLVFQRILVNNSHNKDYVSDLGSNWGCFYEKSVKG